MTDNLKNDLPINVFNKSHDSESLQKLLIDNTIDNDNDERSSCFRNCMSRSICNKSYNKSYNNSYNNKSYHILSCATFVITTIILIMILTIICFVIWFTIKNYKSVQLAIIFIDQIDTIDVDQVKYDIDAMHDSVGEIKDLADALTQIRNKTTFVNQMVYLVNYACRLTGCN